MDEAAWEDLMRFIDTCPEFTAEGLYRALCQPMPEEIQAVTSAHYAEYWD